MGLIPDTESQPVWLGGRDGGINMGGEWEPYSFPSWSFRRTCWLDPLEVRWHTSRFRGHANLVLSVTASAIKDYGKGRRIYSWGMSATLGKVTLHLDPKTGESINPTVLDTPKARARSIRQMLRTANALVDTERVRAAVWQEAMKPWRHSEIFTAEGEPFCTSLEISWEQDWNLPAGEYLRVRRGTCTKIRRSSWSLCGLHGEPSVAPKGWLPDQPKET